MALIAVLGVLMAAPAQALQPRHVTINVDDTFVVTDRCSTPVVISEEGTLHVTLLYNKEGLIVKEIDPSSGLTWTWTSPRTGNSFSYPATSVIIDYGAGAKIGSTFTMKQVGLFGHVPGSIASDAGQFVVTGVVEGFDEFGIPMLDFTDAQVLIQRGNRESFEDVTAAICGKLGA